MNGFPHPVRRSAAVAVVVLLTVWVPAAAWAADNTATGDINGVAADLIDSNTFTINSSTLALAKAAFLTDGTQLSSGATVPSGTNVRFLIYVDNPTDVGVDNVNVQDVLAAGFAYAPGTIKVDASQASGVAEAAIYAAVNGTGTLSDLNDGDAAGISGVTVTAGAAGGNAQVDVPAKSVWAMLFEVTVQ